MINKKIIIVFVSILSITTIISIKLLKNKNQMAKATIGVETGNIEPTTLPSIIIDNKAEADTSYNTLQSLTAQLEILRKDNIVLRQNQEDQAMLLEENKSNPELSINYQKDEDIKVLKTKIDELTDALINIKKDLDASKSINIDSEINSNYIPYNENTSYKIEIPKKAPTYNWIAPKYAIINADSSFSLIPTIPKDQSFYTIPENSTLMNAISITSLIGRIPRGGKVTAPYKFKLKLGQDNLASNGLSIPEVAGVIMSGEALGDYTLKCITGIITSMTFTFKDGTIWTYNSISNSTLDENFHTQSETAELGYITDNFGNCIQGKYIANDLNTISTSAGLAALGAIAEGFASAQTTTITDGADTISSVSGNANNFSISKGTSSGVNSIIKDLSKLQEDSFAAIYVSNNQKVTVHITKEIPIDKRHNGRKLNYQPKYSQQNLD